MKQGIYAILVAAFVASVTLALIIVFGIAYGNELWSGCCPHRFLVSLRMVGSVTFVLSFPVFVIFGFLFVPPILFFSPKPITPTWPYATAIGAIGGLAPVFMNGLIYVVFQIEPPFDALSNALINGAILGAVGAIAGWAFWNAWWDYLERF